MPQNLHIVPLLASHIDNTILKQNVTHGRRLSSTLKNFAKRLDDQFGLPETQTERSARVRSTSMQRVSPYGLALLREIINDSKGGDYSYVEQTYWHKHKEVSPKAMFNIVQRVREVFTLDKDYIEVVCNGEPVRIDRDDTAMEAYYAAMSKEGQ